VRAGGFGTLPTDITFTGQRSDATGLMYFLGPLWCHDYWVNPKTGPTWYAQHAGGPEEDFAEALMVELVPELGINDPIRHRWLDSLLQSLSTSGGAGRKK
jgi:hypothetical protein